MILKKLHSQAGPSQVVPVVKNPPASVGNQRDTGLIPESGRPPGEGNGNPLQYSCLENPQRQRSLAGYIQSMGSHRVRHDWSNLACTLSNTNWHNVLYFKKGKLYSKQKLSDFWVIILHRSTKCLWNHSCLQG